MYGSGWDTVIDMNLLRVETHKVKVKPKTKRVPQKQRNYPVPIYKDGMYDVVKYRGVKGETLYAVFKRGETGSMFADEKTLAEAKSDIDRLKQRDKAGIARLSHDDKRDEWKLKYNPNDLLKSKEEVQGYDLDYEVRGIVKDLNEAGLKTVGSCAGHAPIKGKKDFGFVTLAKHKLSGDDIKVIKKLTDKYKLKKVVIENAGDMLASSITFAPIGLSSGE
jgi:hypothetical protein